MRNATMKSLNGKLLLTAVGIALLATPAYAHKPLHHKQQTAAVHRTHNQKYVQSYADRSRSLFMAVDQPAPSGYGYNQDNYYYPGDY
jgi:hypothetical protein